MLTGERKRPPVRTRMSVRAPTAMGMAWMGKAARICASRLAASSMEAIRAAFSAGVP